jgi:CoA:oxalate CoA-transferase
MSHNGSASAKAAPLEGVVVLDLAQFLAGPFSTQVLGDLGARIVKVEPKNGDPTRHLPPHFIADDSAYFVSTNRNKESVVIDLKDPAGRDLLLKLVGRSDVLIENFRPGVMERLGLSWDEVHAANPRLVMCRITGFGDDGPDRDRPAYDVIVQALSGVMSITGEPGRAPVRTGVPLGDIAAGLYAAVGILGALASARASGVGRCVSVSMLDCQLALLSYVAQYYLVSGEEPGPQGNGHMSIPTYRAFACGDGRQVVIAANSERMWKGLCSALDLDELADDPRFATNADRLSNQHELWEYLEQVFASLSSTEALARLREADVPSANVNTVGQALDEPQARSNGMVVAMRAPDGATVETVGNPIKVDGASPSRYAWPPRLGGDTESVLRDLLGMGHDEVSALAAAGVVALAVDEERALR